jgi:hypothetical protein
MWVLQYFKALESICYKAYSENNPLKKIGEDMKVKNMVMAVTASISTAGTSMAAQALAKDYAQSVHTQAKINTEIIQPWHKGYQQDIKPWAKLSDHGLKGMVRMYNHGIKRV